MTEEPGHRLEVLLGRKNSLRADESADLKNEREEGRVIDQAQGAQEKPARNQAVRDAALGIEEPANDGRGRPVHSRGPLYKAGGGAPCSVVRLKVLTIRAP